MNKIFIHPTVLFTAVYEGNGDSMAVFSLAREKKVSLISSALALRQAQKNLETYEKSDYLTKFLLVVSYMDYVEKDAVLNKTLEKILGNLESVFIEQAHKTNSQIFLTLKNQYFSKTLNGIDLGIRINTPDQFLLEYLDKKNIHQNSLF